MRRFEEEHVSVSTWLGKSEYEEIVKRAQEENRSVGNWIRTQIRNIIKNN